MPTLKATPGRGDFDWLSLAKHFLSCGPGPEPTLFPRRSQSSRQPCRRASFSATLLWGLRLREVKGQPQATEPGASCPTGEVETPPGSGNAWRP